MLKIKPVPNVGNGVRFNRPRMGAIVAAALFLSYFPTRQSAAQTGSEAEPVRYVGGVSIDPSVHEGRLRYAIGVESRQTHRANRTHPDFAESTGWTYNHASNLCYWNSTFYQQYLSNPVDEHVAPGRTLIVTSPDGRNWSKPTIVFPPYTPPPGVQIPKGSKGYMMHQRSAFYIAPGNKLLIIAFYGHSEDPFGEGGIGRVVREAYRDGTFGPIYFLRYSSHRSADGNYWNESNTAFPFYKKSPDKEFIKACDALLADKLKTWQWHDEDQGLDGFYDVPGKTVAPLPEHCEALSTYRRRDGTLVALWKRSYCALSTDDGQTFSKPVKVPTLTMAGGKIWGQRTEDGRFALVYNPIALDEYRYPLALVSGEDGTLFDDMLLVQGEVPPRRFFGRWKDFGPCYVRGIEDGNGNPPGNDLWITYSMNKEDMWVSRIPVPVRYKVEGPVLDRFDTLQPYGPVPEWNIYAPKWAPVSVVPAPGAGGMCLEMKDTDPYDYARAIRVFEEGAAVRTSFRVSTGKNSAGRLEIDLTDRYGNRPVRLCFTEEGTLTATDGSRQRVLQAYTPNHWYTIQVDAEAGMPGRYHVRINGRNVLEGAHFCEAVKSLERLSFRTGPYRNLPNRTTPNEEPAPPLFGADEMAAPATFFIDDVSVTKVR